jgi:translation initiation factor IF-2
VTQHATNGSNNSILSEEEIGQLPLRMHVVTVVGRVDADKVTLLNSLRMSDAAMPEKGGIMQSIGAFRFSLPTADSQTVTSVDTPDHKAFTSMRVHGGEAIDIVVAVVAADDSVIPQTEEARPRLRNARNV